MLTSGQFQNIINHRKIQQIIDDVIRRHGGMTTMNHRLKEMGFDAIKSEDGAGRVVMIDEYGVISFNTRLRGDLKLKKWENSAIYFNGDQGILGVQIGRFDKKRDQGMPIVNMRGDNTIQARDELRLIQDDYSQYNLIPESGQDKLRFDDVELENMEKGSRMILITIPNSKKRF
jgi:hypothetical protein